MCLHHLSEGSVDSPQVRKKHSPGRIFFPIFLLAAGVMATITTQREHLLCCLADLASWNQSCLAFVHWDRWSRIFTLLSHVRLHEGRFTGLILSRTFASLQQPAMHINGRSRCSLSTIQFIHLLCNLPCSHLALPCIHDISHFQGGPAS